MTYDSFKCQPWSLTQSALLSDFSGEGDIPFMNVIRHNYFIEISKQPVISYQNYAKMCGRMLHFVTVDNFRDINLESQKHMFYEKLTSDLA